MEIYKVFTLQENMKCGRPDIYIYEDRRRVSMFEESVIALNTVFEQ